MLQSLLAIGGEYRIDYDYGARREKKWKYQ